MVTPHVIHKYSILMGGFTMIVNQGGGQGGKSPYEIAVENGYTGTEEQFNKNLAHVSGFIVSNEAPENTGILWIDSGNDYILKFWNGTAWTGIRGVWG